MLKKICSSITLYSLFISTLFPSWGWTIEKVINPSQIHEQATLVQKYVLTEYPENFWSFIKQSSDRYVFENSSDELQKYDIDVPFTIDHLSNRIQISSDACVSLKTVESSSYKHSLMNFLTSLKNSQNQMIDPFCQYFFHLLKAHYLNELNKEFILKNVDEGETTSEDSDSDMDDVLDILDEQEQDFIGNQIKEKLLHSSHSLDDENKSSLWASLSKNKDIFFNLISEFLNDPVAYSRHADFIQRELTKGVQNNVEEYIQLKKSLYFQGFWIHPTFEDYRQVLEKASNLGDGEASYRLALLYEPHLEQISSFQVPPFHQELMMKEGALRLRENETSFFVKVHEYYEKAVKQGHLYAHDRLADFLLNQRSGVSTNPQRAFELFKEAAEKGLSVAQRSLGWMYYKGDVVSKDLTLAKKWYKKAINQGLLFAKYEWGCLLLDSNNTDIYDPKAGLTYLKEIQDEPTFEGESARRRIAEYTESLKNRPQSAYKLQWSDIYAQMYHHQNYENLFKAGFHMSQKVFDVENGELHNRFAFDQNFGIETDFLNESIVSLKNGNLIWTYHHHVFELLRNGDLLISGQEADLALEEVKQLNVVNPFGRIILNKGKYAQHLCLKSRGIQLGTEVNDIIELNHLCSVVFDRDQEEVDVSGDLTVQWWLNKQGKITIHKDSRVSNQGGLLHFWSDHDVDNKGLWKAQRLSLGLWPDFKLTFKNEGIIESLDEAAESWIDIHHFENEGVFKVRGSLQGKIGTLKNTLENSLFSVEISKNLKIGCIDNRGVFQLFGGRLNVDKFNQRGKLIIENAEAHIGSEFESDSNQSILTGKNITFSGDGELNLKGRVFVDLSTLTIQTKKFTLRDLYAKSVIYHLVLCDENKETIFHNGQRWTLQHLTARGKDHQTLMFGEDFEMGISQFDLSRSLINRGSLQTDILKGAGEEARIENRGELTVEKYVEGHFSSIIQHCGSLEFKRSSDTFIAEIRNKSKGKFQISDGKVKVRHIKAFDDGSSSKVKVHDLEVIRDVDIHELTNLEVTGQLTSNVALHELRLKQGVTIQFLNMTVDHLKIFDKAEVRDGFLVAINLYNQRLFNALCDVQAINVWGLNPQEEGIYYIKKLTLRKNINLQDRSVSTLVNVNVDVLESEGELDEVWIHQKSNDKFGVINQMSLKSKYFHLWGREKINHLKMNLDHLKLHENSHLVLQYMDDAKRIDHIEIRENATLQFIHEGYQDIYGYEIYNLGRILGRDTHLDYTSIDNKHLIYGEKKIHIETGKYKGEGAALTGESVHLYTREETADSLELDDQSLIGGEGTKNIQIKTQSLTTLRGSVLADDLIRMDIYNSSQKQNLYNHAFISSFQIYEKYKAYITELQRIRHEKGETSEEFQDQRQKYQDFLKRIAQAQEAGLLAQLEFVGFQNMTNHFFIASRVIEKVDNGVLGAMHVLNEQQAIWVAHQDWSNYESHQNGTLSRLGGGIASLTNKGIALYGHLYNHIHTLVNEEQGFFKAFHAEVGIDTLQNMGDFSIDSGFVLLLDVREKDGRSKPVFLPEVRFRESEGDKLRTIINARIQKLVGSPQTVHTLHLGRNVHIENSDLTLIDLDIWGETHIDQGVVDLHNLFVRHKFLSKDSVQFKTYNVWNSQPNSCDKTGLGHIGQLILKNGGGDQHVEGLSIGILKAQDVVSLTLRNGLHEKFIPINQFEQRPQVLWVEGKWKINHLKTNLDHLKLHENSHLALQYIDDANRIEHMELRENATLQFIHEGYQKIHGYHIYNMGRILGYHTHLHYESVDNKYLIHGKERIQLDTAHYKGCGAGLTGESVHLHTWGESPNSIELDDLSLIGGRNTNHVTIDSRSDLTVRGSIQASQEINFVLYDHHRMMKSLTNYGFIGGTYQEGDAILSDQFTNQDLQRLKFSVCGGVHNYGKIKAIHAARYHSSYALWLRIYKNSLTSFLLYTDHSCSDENPGVFSGIDFNDHNEKSDLYIGKTSVGFKNYVSKIIPRSNITEIFSFLNDIKRRDHVTLNLASLWDFDYRAFLPFVKGSLTIQGTSLTLSQNINLPYPVYFELSEDITFAAQFLSRGLKVRARNMSIQGPHIVGIEGKSDIHLSGKLENIEGGKLLGDDDMTIFAERGIRNGGSDLGDEISFTKDIKGKDIGFNNRHGNKIHTGSSIKNVCRKKSNGSTISSFGILNVSSQENIDNSFGSIFGRSSLFLSVQNTITNNNGSIESLCDVTLNCAKFFGKCVKNNYKHVVPFSVVLKRWQGWDRITKDNHFEIIYEYIESNGGVLRSSVGNIYVNVLEEMVLQGGEIFSHQNIFINNVLVSSSNEELARIRQVKILDEKAQYKNCFDMREAVRRLWHHTTHITEEYPVQSINDIRELQILKSQVLGGQTLTIDTKKFELKNVIARAGEDVTIRAHNITMSHSQHHTQRHRTLPFDPNSSLFISLPEVFVETTPHDFSMHAFKERGVEGALMAAQQSQSLVRYQKPMLEKIEENLYAPRDPSEPFLVTPAKGQTEEEVRELLKETVYVPSKGMNFEMFSSFLNYYLGVSHLQGLSGLDWYGRGLESTRDYMKTLPSQSGLDRIVELSLGNQDRILFVMTLKQQNGITIGTPHLFIPAKVIKEIAKWLQSDISAKNITTYSEVETILRNMITNASEEEIHASTGQIILEGIKTMSKRFDAMAPRVGITTTKQETSSFHSNHHSDGYTDVTTHSLTHYPAQFDNEITRLKADQSIYAEAPVFNGSAVMEVSEGGHISVIPVYDTFTQHIKSVDKGGWGPTKYRDESHHHTHHETPVAPEFNGEVHTLTAPKGSIHLQYPHIKGKMMLQAIDGIVKLAGAYNISVSELITQSSDAFWMSADRESTTQKTYHNPIIEGEVIVEAKELHLELARKMYREVLDKINHNKECELDVLLQDDVFEHISEELYSTPSQGLTIMVAIAAAIATYGVASGWGAAAAKGLTGFTATATQAAVTATTMSLSARIATSLVQNKGNLGAVQRDLFSSRTLIDLTKTAAASVLTAGIASSIGAAPTMTHLQESLKSSTSFAQSLKTVGGYMMSSTAAHFMVDTAESTLRGNLNGNILLKSGIHAVHSAAVETVASSVCHQIGVAFQGERTVLDEIQHKLLHGLTAAGASAALGHSDAALASAGAAMVGETVIDTLDAIDRKNVQTMTPQEKEVIKSQEAKKALDQKTNKSLFKIEIRKRDIANLLTAFMLTFTTPDHLVAEAYQASQRAMDFNHDVSQLRMQERETEEEEKEPVIEIFHDHEEGPITLVCSEKEYEVYNEKYQRWKARDEAYQQEINESGGLRKTYIETKRSLYRLAKRPNTPPRKLGTWSEDHVQKGLDKVSRISSQLSQSHAQDLQNLKSDPLNAAHLLKAPATITNEILGQGLRLMGEVVTPVFDKTASVARQVLRAQGVSPQVASDVVYGLEGATLLYGGVKGVASLNKASRLSKAHSVKAVTQVPPVRTIEALGLEVPKVKMGRGILADAIPEGSKLEYLGPGRLRYEGVEFRAVRDLSHLDESYLRRMFTDGVNAKDINGVRLDGHHYNQIYHREPDAFIAYIPKSNHCISNKVQHPKGTTGGLSLEERQDWKSLNRRMNKEMARTELLRRGIDVKGKK